MTFWIVKGQSAVKKLLHQCTVCAWFNGRAYTVPESPQMPEFRFQECAAFSHVGLDDAGPLYDKDKEVGMNIWIALFTSGVSRALHLELVPDMTTEAFLRCFKRFATRRGTPLKIISDNSKTVKSANRELLQIQSDPVFKNFFAQLHIQWCFHVEKALWWGRFFERLIRSVKNCLKKVVGNSTLILDELSTVIVEVEAVLNSRPLTYIAAEEIEEPLTPAHLLTERHLIGLPEAETVLEMNEDPEILVRSDRPSVTARMEHIQCLLKHFWKRWRDEYLVGLRDMHRFNITSGGRGCHIALGDIVLVHNEAYPRTYWRLGKVERLIKGRDE